MTDYGNQDSVDIREHLALLGQNSRFIILFCVSAAITALTMTYLFSEKYQATSTVFYRQAEVTVMKQRDHEAFGSPEISTPFKVISSTVRELVESEVILRPVVEELNLHIDSEGYTGPWYSQIIDRFKDWARGLRDDIMSILKYGRLIDEDPVVSAIKTLAGNIDIVNKDSYVFLIRVRDKNPQRVALIADKLGEVLVEFLRLQSVNAGQTKKAQIEGLMAEKDFVIETNSERLESMLSENDLVSIPHETERGVVRLSELKSTRDELVSEIALNEARLVTIRDMIQNGGRGSDNYIQPEDKKRLESEKVFTELELRGLRANLRSVDSSIDELSELLQKLPALQLEFDELDTDLDAARRDWIQLRDALQDAVVRSTQTQSEATVLHAATVPSAPVSPVKLYHVALAAGLALMLGISLVFVLTFLQLNIFFPVRQQPQPQQ